MINLSDYQIDAVNKLRNGSILWGGVGSGKSRTSLAYYEKHHLPDRIDIFIITTAKKRDSMEWEEECAPLLLTTNEEISLRQAGVRLKIDSWNNIIKYRNVKDAFFIFDEQRVVGAGAWVKSFLNIAENNKWILLTATPGDTWMDYIPVFIANGFYKNRTEFIREHVVYSSFTKFPKVDRYVGVAKLLRLRQQVLVQMKYEKRTESHEISVITSFDRHIFDMVMKHRWDPYNDKPIKDVSALCYCLRKVVNSDPTRLLAVTELIEKHPKIIVFYNFNYELDLLLDMTADIGIPVSQWNGHKHEEISKTDEWVYLVQYTAGAEGWNCIETDAIIFYSQNYSYKTMAQAAGRIDRMNTPFEDLYYYHLRSESKIDKAIYQALRNKRNFNDANFINL